LPQHARPVQNYGLDIIKKVEGALLADAHTTNPTPRGQPSAALPTYAVVNDKLAGMLQELTSEQRDVLNKITAYIANGQHGPGQLQLILGPPGSGKTHLVNMLRTVGASSTPRFAVEAVAYTGIAASLIGGATINSLFSIPIDAGNTGTKDEDGFIDRLTNHPPTTQSRNVSLKPSQQTNDKRWKLSSAPPTTSWRWC
jgi:hypothetical protein